MGQKGVPGQENPYIGVSAVFAHFPAGGPLFGPQMSRYVSGPQRGKCVADLGLVPSEKKIGRALSRQKGL